MAKITTITNPLTGQPAQVDQLDHTAQQIDDGLNIARNVSNPNLLDNPDFAIWQRYPDGVYTGVPNKVFVADRFKIQSSHGGFTSVIKRVDGGGIHNESGPHCRIFYNLENASLYNGRVMTLSSLKANNKFYTKTMLVSNWTDTTDILAYFPISDLYWLYAGDMIYRMKLELGDHQTLAHQDENGNWVLNEIPDYGEQLRRCQRYYYQTWTGASPKTDKGYIGFNAATNNSTPDVFRPPVTMRTTPSVTVYNPLTGNESCVADYSSNAEIAGIVNYAGRTTEKVIMLNHTQKLTNGRKYICHLKLDAEIH